MRNTEWINDKPTVVSCKSILQRLYCLRSILIYVKITSTVIAYVAGWPGHCQLMMCRIKALHDRSSYVLSLVTGTGNQPLTVVVWGGVNSRGKDNTVGFLCFSTRHNVGGEFDNKDFSKISNQWDEPRKPNAKVWTKSNTIKTL